MSGDSPRQRLIEGYECRLPDCANRYRCVLNPSEGRRPKNLYPQFATGLNERGQVVGQTCVDFVEGGPS